MAIRRCEAGEHTYDDSQHSSCCPFCRKTRLATSPGGIGAGNGIGNMDIPPQASPQPVQAKTTPAPGTDGGQSSGGPKTRVVFGGGSGEAADFGEVMPVVGWLVVINGEGRGRDLRITPQMNNIGREKGEIILNFGDASISREKHAYLAYAPGKNTFWFGHGDGKNLSEINNEPVIGKQELQPFDRILIGKTELLFVPLCGENFSWDHPES